MFFLLLWFFFAAMIVFISEAADFKFLCSIRFPFLQCYCNLLVFTKLKTQFYSMLWLSVLTAGCCTQLNDLSKHLVLSLLCSVQFMIVSVKEDNAFIVISCTLYMSFHMFLSFVKRIADGRFPNLFIIDCYFCFTAHSCFSGRTSIVLPWHRCRL